LGLGSEVFFVRFTHEAHTIAPLSEGAIAGLLFSLTALKQKKTKEQAQLPRCVRHLCLAESITETLEFVKPFFKNLNLQGRNSENAILRCNMAQFCIKTKN